MAFLKDNVYKVCPREYNRSKCLREQGDGPMQRVMRIIERLIAEVLDDTKESSERTRDSSDAAREGYNADEIEQALS